MTAPETPTGSPYRGWRRVIGRSSIQVRLPAALVVSLFSFRRMMPVAAEVLVQVLGIDGKLDHVHFVTVQIHHKHAHPFAFRMNEDQRLIEALAAGFANHPLPAGAQLF